MAPIELLTLSINQVHELYDSLSTIPNTLGYLIITMNHQTNKYDLSMSPLKMCTVTPVLGVCNCVNTLME